MTKDQLKTQIDTDITNKTSAKSITPTNVGKNMKDVVDFIPDITSKENISNKSINIVTDATSDIKYPSVKAVNDGLTLKVDKVTGKSLVLDTEITKLSHLNDTTDMQKPVSTAQQAALDNLETLLQSDIQAQLVDSTLINGVTTSSSVPPTGNIHAIGVGAGTYTNWNNGSGGMVVPANNIGTLSRVGGVYSVSLTAFTNINKILPWVAQSYLINDQVNHLGKDWVANAAIVAGDIPGTSSKWVERLKGYVKNDIYAIGTTGANIPSLLFIKDFSITNAVAGKIYSIASVVKNGTDTRIKIYSADDYAGTNITLKLEFILQNTDYLVLKTEILVTGEIISIIASPAELPSAVSFTTMYGLDYKLNPSSFKNGKAGESLSTTLLLSKDISYFPYLTTTSNTAKLNNAIKELYLFGVSEQDVKLTTFKKNAAGNDYNVTIYNSAVTTKLASFVSLGTVLSGVQILPLLSTTSVLVGYVLIDWDVIVDNTFYSGVTTSDVLLTHKVFFKETNPILFTKINETRIISLESGINIGAINNYPFLVESSYSLAVNHAIKELFLFNIVEQETKVTTFKKNAAGNDYNITVYNTTLTTKLASFVSLGTVLSGTQIHALITPLGDITGYVMINWDVVADGYFFQGVNNSSLILTSDVFYKLKSPKIFNYLDNLAASYDIGNYDNEFAFDLAEIERLRVRALGIIPNYNLPHTKEHGFFSTDILNELTLTDGSSDFDWIKSKAPNFYFNAKKRGCIVLFDEAGLAYIINQNNEKKFITLT